MMSLRDLVRNTWALDALGELGLGESKTIVRSEQAMSLNHGGGEVELVVPDGTVAHSVSYARVISGEVITVDGN